MNPKPNPYRKQDKTKPPGYYCRVCKVRKLRDEFPGKGHKGRVCQDCAKVSNSERLGIRHEQEIFQFLRQASINDVARERLEYLAKSKNKQTKDLAALLLKIADIAPYKKGRFKLLAELAPDLLQQLKDTGLAATYD